MMASKDDNCIYNSAGVQGWRIFLHRARYGSGARGWWTLSLTRDLTFSTIFLYRAGGLAIIRVIMAQGVESEKEKREIRKGENFKYLLV